VSGRGLPRISEVVAAGLALVILSPLLALIALAVALGSGLPILFRQERVGRGGVPFTLVKFRTMRNGPGGPGITAGDDRRITRVGRMLRRTKLDELPELWNVLRGDMSLVGPRPESPRYVSDEPRWDRVLSVRPGLTDPTTLSLLDEEALLASVAGDREEFYIEQLLPKKLDGYLDYLDRRTWRTDLQVIRETVSRLLGMKRHRS
jgi:lipopolysaccharide/colanic/teichoic acid biosynthesis glycosyltransferase